MLGMPFRGVKHRTPTCPFCFPEDQQGQPLLDLSLLLPSGFNFRLKQTATQVALRATGSTRAQGISRQWQAKRTRPRLWQPEQLQAIRETWEQYESCGHRDLFRADAWLRQV